MIRAVAAREDRIVVTYDSDHAIAVRADGVPPRVFRLKDEHLRPHVQAELVANAIAFVDDVADLPPVYMIGDEFL
jgi:predicted nuclease of predicted toxin-antitoxin system